MNMSYVQSKPDLFTYENTTNEKNKYCNSHSSNSFKKVREKLSDAKMKTQILIVLVNKAIKKVKKFFWVRYNQQQ